MNVNQEKIKAIIEAMIFVSPEPVTVRQMLTKIKQVLKKDADSLLVETEETVDAENSAEFDASEKNEEQISESDNANEVYDEQQMLANAEEEAEDDSESENSSTDNDDTDSENDSENEFDITHHHVKQWLKDIAEKFKDVQHGFELVYVAKGYQFRTKYDVSLYLRAEKKSLPSRLSVSAMETLAIVSYEQPVARSKIDDIRGVDSGGVLKTLLEKEFIRIVGRADEPGQPLLYGTTQKFLEVFNLQSLKELPSLHEIQEFNAAEDEESEDEVKYFDSEEEIEQRMNELSEEEDELMRDLDDSLKKVKDTEKEIEFFENKSSQGQSEEGPVPQDNQ